MALSMEIAEVMEKSGKMFEIAEKIEYKQNLTNEEKEIAEISDAWVKEIANKGTDANNEIAAFVQKTLTEEVYNAPDELLDMIFDRGSIGEFDDEESTFEPKNTLVAYEAAKGGTVDRSFIDWRAIKTIRKNRQVETDLSYADMRRNGFKSVATLTTFAKETLQNAMFYDIFSVIDKAIVGGEQVVNVAGKLPTQAAVDAFNLYLLDRSSDAVAVCLSKYAQALGRMDGRTQYLSPNMKDEFNRYGLVNFIDGVKVASISGAHKTGKNELLLPDSRIFGIAGKVGTLDMVGDIHVYEDMDHSDEKLILRVKDFTYGVSISNIENCNKMVFTN